MLVIILAFLVSDTKTQEVATPASLLGPKNYNHHAFDAEQIFKNFKSPKPTKKGPILFPNDGPPPPPRPLIVTSRPLLESIARSDLNTSNNIPASSQVNHITQGYLARVKEYQPFGYVTLAYDIGPTEVPYADVLANSRGTVEDNRYNDYEKRTILPPIYKSLSNHAQKVLKAHQNEQQFDYQTYQIKNPDYLNDYSNNVLNDDVNNEYNEGENYAFSYAVKDQTTGDDFSHSQRSKGSATNGEYRVRLPDGRMQIVSYTADENGYKADVRYDDENKPNVNSINTHHNNYADNSHIDYTNNQVTDYSDKHKDYTDKVTQNSVKPTELTAQNRGFKPDYSQKFGNDYYQYPDVKEYSDDYSSEYNSNYAPHQGKFSFAEQREFDNFVPTVKPTYEELKDLFVNNNIYSARQVIPATTPNYETTTERVVVIGSPKGNIFTNVRNIIPVTETPLFPNAVTPGSYLASTIAHLRDKINSGHRAILSNSFLERINKYLKYK